MPYTPRAVAAPRLTGLPLRAFAALVEAPGLGDLIRGQMLTQIGMPRLRAADVGTASPLRPPWLDDPALVPPGPTAAPGVPADPTQAPAAPDTAGFRHASIADYRAAYAEGRADPTSVAEALLAAHARHDGEMRTFIALDAADVRKQAAESAARLRAGQARSWLEGVPVCVKDELDQVPYPTTVGTSFLGKSPAAHDASAVARLRAAGALLVGKTNMHELGIGVTGINPHHGAARNPYDPAHVTGGSSSGSAAAAALGYCPVAIGADGGGSIRIPAALCGMVGLKATWGRISEHGAAPLCWNVGHVGPIGAHAADVAAVYALLSGVDPLDPATRSQPPALLPDGRYDGLRVGVMASWFEHADPAVVERCNALLAGLGVTLVPVDLPDPDLVRLAHLVVIVGEMSASQLPYPGAPYGADTGLNFSLGRGLRAGDFAHALRVRGALAEGWRAVFEQVDLVATPTTGCTAPPLRPDAHQGESDLVTLDRVMRYAHAPNLFGFPAVSIPAGYDAQGLPVGLQLIGRPWSEHLLLGLALRATPLVERRAPKVHVSLLEGG